MRASDYSRGPCTQEFRQGLFWVRIMIKGWASVLYGLVQYKPIWAGSPKVNKY